MDKLISDHYMIVEGERRRQGFFGAGGPRRAGWVQPTALSLRFSIFYVCQTASRSSTWFSSGGG
jgi:hypothetical protein